MKDWKGNEIKEGDEICFIQIKRGGMFSNAKFLIPATGETIDIPTEPESDCWIVGDYFKVFKCLDSLFYSVNYGDFTGTMAVEGCKFDKDYRNLIGIKGKSDKK